MGLEIPIEKLIGDWDLIGISRKSYPYQSIGGYPSLGHLSFPFAIMSDGADPRDALKALLEEIGEPLSRLAKDDGFLEVVSPICDDMDSLVGFLEGTNRFTMLNVLFPNKTKAFQIECLVSKWLKSQHTAQPSSSGAGGSYSAAQPTSSGGQKSFTPKLPRSGTSSSGREKRRPKSDAQQQDHSAVLIPMDDANVFNRRGYALNHSQEISIYGNLFESE